MKVLKDLNRSCCCGSISPVHYRQTSHLDQPPELLSTNPLGLTHTIYVALPLLVVAIVIRGILALRTSAQIDFCLHSGNIGLLGLLSYLASLVSWVFWAILAIGFVGHFGRFGHFGPFGPYGT